jgi:hypothetical protein
MKNQNCNCNQKTLQYRIRKQNYNLVGKTELQIVAKNRITIRQGKQHYNLYEKQNYNLVGKTELQIVAKNRITIW